MDALSDALRGVELTGGAYLEAEFTDPWCVWGHLEPRSLGPMLAPSRHFILYHYVVEGRLELQLPGERPIRVEAGEVIVLPRNDRHKVGSRLSLPPRSGDELVRRSIDSGLKRIVHGGGGDATRMVCGYLASPRDCPNPLFAALPSWIRLDTHRLPTADWIETTLRFAAQELARGRPGSATVLGKVSELLFVEAIRHYLDSLAPDQTGWLAGLKDLHVARALGLMHARPGAAWTAEALARETGLSRSALNDRFTRLIGMAPMQYLAGWRMRHAARRLRSSPVPIQQLAAEVGYDSAAAFNRAFKRIIGQPPATWRRRADGSASPSALAASTSTLGCQPAPG